MQIPTFQIGFPAGESQLDVWGKVVNIFQGFGITVAAVVGGWWAWYRMQATRELDQAELSLKRSKNDLAVGEAQLVTARRAMVERRTLVLRIRTRPFQDPISGQWYIGVWSRTINVGNSREVANWTESRVCTARIVSHDGAAVTFGPWVKTAWNIRGGVASVKIAPGETVQHLFVVPAPGPGLYVVHLDTPTSAEEEVEARKATGLREGVSTWSAETMVVVPRDKTEGETRSLQTNSDEEKRSNYPIGAT